MFSSEKGLGELIRHASVCHKNRKHRKLDRQEHLKCRRGVCLVSAYVLAKVEAGKERNVLKEIKTIDGVERATATYGTYDLVVEVNLESIQDLDRFVFDRLRKISHVRETMTVICSETVT